MSFSAKYPPDLACSWADALAMTSGLLEPDLRRIIPGRWVSSLIVVLDLDSTGRRFSILYSLYLLEERLAKNINVWLPPAFHRRKY